MSSNHKIRAEKERSNTINSGDGTETDSQLHLAAQKQNTCLGYNASPDTDRFKECMSSVHKCRWL